MLLNMYKRMLLRKVIKLKKKTQKNKLINWKTKKGNKINLKYTKAIANNS